MMSKSYLFLAVFFLHLNVFSQVNFYDVDSIQEIHIYFYDSNWDYQLDSLYIEGNNDRIIADLIINGIAYDSVGVRYKGFSSASIDRIKNPFNIKLDYIIEEQAHEGVEKLKLSNVYQDPSFIREVLTYEIISNYMPVPKANYANVYVNDTLIGLYTNVQSINKDFLNNNFGSKYNPFFKCSPNNLDISPGGENSNLSQSHGLDSLNYINYYDLKSDYGWEALYNLIDTLNNYSESSSSILNIDRTLWMHALNYTLINFDSYIGYGQNYYLYKDQAGQWNTIIWDLNMSFGSFRLTDASSIYFNGFDISQAQNMDPLIHYNQISVSPRPLLRNLLVNERNQKMYLAHIRTIVEEFFLSQLYYERGQHFQNMISSSVQIDPNKFYSYSDFTNNLTSQVSLVSGDCPGITQLMDARSTYLSNYVGFTGEPVISNISYSPEGFSLGDDIFISAQIEDGNNVFLAYRFGNNVKFKKVTMLDDGNHGDGAANDGVYGAMISNSSNSIDYYLYADNDSAGTFSPVRAAYEFYNIQSTLQPGNLVINELMSNNLSIVTDASAKFEDWIELYNPTNSPISTNGLFLTDTLGLLHKWKLPSYLIPARGYAIFWADDDVGQGDMHANFQLSNLGETLVLTSSDSLVIDSITYLPQDVDISFGRSPNGLGSFTMLTPTFNNNNDFPNSVEQIINNAIIYPNPFTDFVYLHTNDDIEVRDVLGKLMYSYKEKRILHTSDWKTGVYFIHLKSKNQTIKVIKV